MRFGGGFFYRDWASLPYALRGVPLGPRAALVALRCIPIAMRLLPILLVILLAPAAGVLAQSAPDAPGYTISPGDVVDFTFRWTPEFNQSVTVQPDGRVTLMSAGEFKASGLTMAQLHDEVAKRSGDKLRDPEFTITLKESDRPHFVVAGEVATPGRFDLKTSTTALQAVPLAGGVKETGAMDHVVLFRRLNSEMAEVHRLNFIKSGRGGKPVDDMLLQPGDMLLVSRNRLENIGRFIQTFNLGVYFNPLQTGGF